MESRKKGRQKGRNGKKKLTNASLESNVKG